MVVVQSLFVYPIKGCAGIPLQAAAITSTGDCTLYCGSMTGLLSTTQITCVHLPMSIVSVCVDMASRFAV